MYERERLVAIQAVSDAARLCSAVARELGPNVLKKNDASPVTVADFGSQALLCRALEKAFPDDPVIAEEDAGLLQNSENEGIRDQVLRHVRSACVELDPAGATGIDAGEVARLIDRGGTSQFCRRFWTIDPIDGTKGFLRGEQYAVALALIVDGTVVVAALACPNLASNVRSAPGAATAAGGPVFHAIRGEGAYVSQQPRAGAAESRFERMCISPCDDLTQARFCESVESGHSAQSEGAKVAALLGITAPPLRMDSQAKYAVVARGDAEIYLRLPTKADYREKIWDHAAGSLVVTQAGGRVTDIHGQPLDFTHGRELTTNRGVVVSNGGVHQAVIDAIRAVVGPAPHV
jgi:3'(2'), 5'-bisphosphate nucleotidase